MADSTTGRVGRRTQSARYPPGGAAIWMMDGVRSRRYGVIAASIVALFLTGCGVGEELVPIPEGTPPGPGAPVPVIDIDAPGRTAALLNGWASEHADRLEMPVAALEAYGYAAVVMGRSRPECGVAWTTLAGIGSVESDHGRHRGAEVGVDGLVQPGIIGIALDGSPGVAEIRDTDGGQFDGDPVFDRAVGPMQFIPETWRKWGVDANGDGVADPHSIDDAALTAARYLCVSGGDLLSAEGWSRALFTYNQSESYMELVRDRAAAYSVGRRV